MLTFYIGRATAFNMKPRFTMLVLLIAFGCAVKDTESTKTPAPQSDQVADKPLTKPGRKDSLLLINVVTHYFSSPTVEDTFKITLRGETVRDATVEFEIRTPEGYSIHYESFPSNYLIGYGLSDKATERERTDYIKDRILRLFNEENFKQPAISSEDVFDESYSDKEIWDDIHADTTAISFEYIIAEETIRHIAYSKKLKQVMLIYTCC